MKSPSLHYVLYEMTWAEYELRLFSYKRQTEREEKNFREVAWASLRSFNIDPKKMPKTKEKYWAIGEERSPKRVSDKARNAFAKAMQEYKEKVKANGTVKG